MASGSNNPFEKVGQDVNEEDLDTWLKMKEKLRGLVQMSDDDDDDDDDINDEDGNLDEVMIDDSLLITNVTADSLNLNTNAEQSLSTSTAGTSSQETAEPRVNQASNVPAKPAVKTFVIPSELTLQYLQGKITFIEFSELMEQDNMEELHIELIKSDTPSVAMEESVITTATSEDDTTATAENDADDTMTVPPDDSKDSGILEKRQKKQGPAVKRKRHRRKWDLPPRLEQSMGEVNMLFAHGKHEEAIKQCLEIIRLAPNASKPFQTLGMIYEDMGDMQKSLQYALIAAYLDPSDPEEWVRLASMCLEQDDSTMAIRCYTRAISAGGPNRKQHIMDRCHLYESIKEFKKAVEGYQLLLPLLDKSECDMYFKLARSLTKNFYETGEKLKAIDTMKAALVEHPEHIISEDVNLLLELIIPEKQFEECLAVLVKHCGVVFNFVGGKVWSSDQEMPTTEFTERTPLSCEVPEMLPIDLRVKLAVSLINLHLTKIVKPVLAPLLEADIETNGDLYLDVAEAYMDNHMFKEALAILKRLVKTRNYNLAAVWLKYGECQKSLNDIHGAVLAYSKVVELAPSHYAARMSLSALQQQLGKHDEALETLEHEEFDEGKLSKEEQQMMLQKCHLLNSQGKLDEFLVTAKHLLFHEWRDLEAESMDYLQAIRTYKHRKETLMAHFSSRGKEIPSTSSYLSRSRKPKMDISCMDLWDIFEKLCRELIMKKRFSEFEDLVILGMLCPLFSEDDKLLPDFEWLVLTASILSENAVRAYPFGRHLVNENLEDVHAWNVFLQVIMACSDSRHNRFLLRKMIHEPNNIALGIMNGHTSMGSGSYKHSLGEYANVFKRIPTDPLVSLCIGLDFIHTASQRFSAKRQYLITQGLAFLHNYIELRGEGQESYYNLGRALHQINVVYAALHCYKKALDYPPAVGEKGGMFDLSSEIAYNMSLIYQASGCTDYARYLLYKYCTV